MYGLALPTLFPYLLLVTTTMAIVEIGRDVPNQSVVRIAAATTTAAMGVFIRER